MSAIKEGVEDYNRHRQDYLANNRSFGVVRHYKAKSKSISSGGSQPRLARRQGSQEHIITTPVSVVGASRAAEQPGAHDHRRQARPRGSGAEVEMQQHPQAGCRGRRRQSDQWLTPVTSKDISRRPVAQDTTRTRSSPQTSCSSRPPTRTPPPTSTPPTWTARPCPRCASRLPSPCNADTPEKLLRLSGRVKAEPANASLYQFQARIEMDAGQHGNRRRPDRWAPARCTSMRRATSVHGAYPARTQTRAANVDKSPAGCCTLIGDQQLCLRGSRLVNTDWVYGLVVYTGYQTKMMLNRNAPTHQGSRSFEASRSTSSCSPSSSSTSSSASYSPSPIPR